LNDSDVATFQSYFSNMFNRLRSGTLFRQAEGTQPTSVLNRIRNMSTAQWAAVGVVAAEVIGFFSIGEMIGRMKLVGYRSSAQEEHH
jgi:F-type H+-transporting ATPase subunit g